MYFWIAFSSKLFYDFMMHYLGLAGAKARSFNGQIQPQQVIHINHMLRIHPS